MSSNDVCASPARVVITGLGMIMPGADGVAAFWHHLQAGASQLTRIDSFATAGLPVHVGAQVSGFDHRRHLPDLPDCHAAKYGREQLIVIAAVSNALRDARLTPGSVDPARIGLIASSSRGPLAWWEQRRAADMVGRNELLQSLPGAPATLAAIYTGIQGTVLTLSSACVGGSQAVGIALRELRAGTSDAVLVGGHEFPLAPKLVERYLAMGDGVLSRQNARPQEAMRPYDRRRSGFALGEGALFLCLETLDSARRRGASAYAQILAERSANEAAHPTTMDLTGKKGAALVRDLLRHADLTPDDIDYVCGHGSATAYNDLAESKVTDLVFAPHGAGRRPPIGSVKPIYGHSLGMSAIVNIAATALMLRHQVLVPTINCVEPDPACAGDHVTDGPRRTPVRNAISLAYALGSQTAAVALADVRNQGLPLADAACAPASASLPTAPMTLPP